MKPRNGNRSDRESKRQSRRDAEENESTSAESVSKRSGMQGRSGGAGGSRSRVSGDQETEAQRGEPQGRHTRSGRQQQPGDRSTRE